MVDPNHPRLSIVRQCRLVSIARSSFYYEGTGETPLTLRLMRLIDEQFLETPFFGSRQMTRWLRRQGDTVSRKRYAGKLHVPFERRTEASPLVGASSDPTPPKRGNRRWPSSWLSGPAGTRRRAERSHLSRSRMRQNPHAPIRGGWGRQRPRSTRP